MYLYIPKIGENITEAYILRWYKTEGDIIKKDELLVEISTDKVDIDLPSEYEGIIEKIIIEENQLVKIGEPIAIIKPYSEIDKGDKHPIQEKNSNLFLSPKVKQLLEEYQINLDEITPILGKGRKNRITKKDVLNYIHSTKKEHLSTGDKIIKPDAKRKQLIKNITTSYQNIPQVTTVIEVDVTELLDFVQANKPLYIEKGLKLNYSYLIYYQIIQSLKQFPQFNSWYKKNKWIWKGDINLGIATSLSNGNLIVPNLKNVNSLSLDEFIQGLINLSQKTKQQNITPEDVKGTTFTISNTGVFGSLFGTPIIIEPQIAILSLGEIRDVLGYNQKKEIIELKKIYLSLSYDHRVIDGVIASKFLKDIKNKLINYS